MGSDTRMMAANQQRNRKATVAETTTIDDSM